ASIQEPFNTIHQTGLFSIINLVTNLGDTFIPTEISKSVNKLLKIHFGILFFEKFDIAN
ncbi:17569_t:CDS:2, partial [Dentiscutata erythropus]